MSDHLKLYEDALIKVNELRGRITTLKSVIEQCEKALEAFMNEDNWHEKGKVAPKWLLNQGAEALAAIRAIKEGK